MSDPAASSKEQISTAQTAAIVINYMLGAGILTLPRTTTEAVGTPDVWISILLSGMLILVAGIIVVVLCRRYPGKTVFEYAPAILGPFLGNGLSFIFILYFLMISAFEIRIMAEVTGLYLLEGTPTWAIVMVFVWIGLYLIAGGIGAIARLYELILPVTLIFFVLAMLLSIKIFDINNLRPVLGQGIKPVFYGLKSTFLAYTGYEIMFVAMAFMKKPDKGIRAIAGGVLTPMVIYLITFVMVVGGLSVEGVKNKTFPTLDLMRSFEIEGLIFERFESLLLVIWIMQIFSTHTITMYAASLGASQMMKKKIMPFLLAGLPLVYIAALAPKNEKEAFAMGELLGNVSIILFGVVPLLILLIDMLRSRMRRSSS
ncbi:GerAB/ArcD/ProY family transporter [Paenibacillus sp. JX-17]|uniref:GerAB/ArcD/ProY family transporter n=1 Tax=Paenibacillus lacisoli TaxID=3064525 RepID=A0ABT9CFN1_9BACL|nr:GerAB/ArcD/ProY family transporter [Paenibacillus sp. JX-17]MDO7908062.1 GerAB/ArcD/ProY family transporter [Paenibacillus sp. JX-17]